MTARSPVAHGHTRLHRHAFVGALALVVLAAACAGEGTKPPVARQTAADSAQQVLFGMRTVMAEKGILRGELLADTAYVFDENTRYELRGIDAVFNSASGTKSGDMRADRGRYDLRLGVVEGYGNVEVNSVDGRRLTTSHLRYDQGRDEISSDSAFVLIDADRRQSGIGFRTDPNLTRFQVHRQSRATGTVVVPIQ